MITEEDLERRFYQMFPIKARLRKTPKGNYQVVYESGFESNKMGLQEALAWLNGYAQAIGDMKSHE